MGTLTNELMYKLKLPFLGYSKKVKCLVVEPNSTYETEYIDKDQTGKLLFYPGTENYSKNPKIVGADDGHILPGTKNASTNQPCYVWYRGEKFCYPLASRDMLSRSEDEDAQAIMLIEHGKLIERGKWQKQDTGTDKTRQILIVIFAINVMVAIGVWQVLGAI